MSHSNCRDKSEQSFSVPYFSHKSAFSLFTGFLLNICNTTIWKKKDNLLHILHSQVNSAYKTPMSQFTKPSPSSRTRWVNLNSSEFFLIISPTECFYQERKHATQTPLNSLVRNNTHESKETVVLNSNNSLKRQLLTYTELHKTSIGFSNAKFKKNFFSKDQKLCFLTILILIAVSLIKGCFQRSAKCSCNKFSCNRFSFSQ